MEVIKTESVIKVKSDYNKAFISKAKMIQGKWNAPYWVFPVENEKEVNDLLLSVYGENGEPQECVTILVDISKEYGDTIYLCGRILCSRRSRDSEVRLAENVMLVSGGFYSSGGSRAYPDVNPIEGTVLKVKECPLSFYERVKDEPNVTLCEEHTEHTNKQKLIEEKERLLRRIEEIDSLLAGQEGEQK